MQKTLSLKSNIPEFDYAWIKQDISVWVSLLTGSEKMESQTAAYYKAKIISVNFNTKKVDISFVSEEGKQETKTEILFSNIFQTNETKDKGFNDMVDMENLNEAELLYNIKNRYEKNEIFTYVGPTLLVVNPYQNIPGLIGEECLNNYQKKVYEPSYILKDVEPHVYAISADCVRKLCESKKNQAIVISGESGAGKTENAKLAMKFITSIGKAAMSNFEAQTTRPLFNQRRSKMLVMKDEVPDISQLSIDSSCETNQSKNESTSKVFLYRGSLSQTQRQSIERKSLLSSPSNKISNRTVVYEGIEDKILSCNPILESFGNAKTVRNDNSSRFGKLVLLLMDKESRKIKGAMMTNYLLEKSRVIQQMVGERNYHIFYHLLNGGDQKLKNDLDLSSPKNYEYLKKSECFEVNTLNDKELFLEVTNSFKAMKFHQNEIKGIWNIVAAILHLGNLTINEGTLDTQKNTPCTFNNEKTLTKISELLYVAEDKLKIALTNKTRTIGGAIYKTCMAKFDCLTLIDSFAKSLYERLFVFLVQRLNYAISSPEYRNIKIETILQEKNRFSIDLLDIFGFEVFKKNSFEQFCINFANEKLQQLYITYVFKSEIDQFILEGLKAHLNELKFKDNQTLIDLIDSQPLGIFSLLNESSSVASTDEALLNIITKNHKNNENLKIPKGSKENFIIIHTAKDVEYNITNFRTKNKDEISNDLEEIMGLSTFKTISCIYLGINHFENVDELVSEESDESEKEEKIVITNSPTTKVKFLSAKFRKQMNDLMSELNSCEVHFIRCIKPNEEKKKNYFVPLLALNQIRYLGVLESIKIRKESYPIRRLYRHFFEKYYELDDLFSKNSFLKHCDKKTDFIEATKKLIEKFAPQFGTDMILYGNTKIFLKLPVVTFFDGLWRDKLKKKNLMAKKIQKIFFRYQQLKILRKLFKSIRRIQTLFKVKNEYKKFKETQKKIRFLQKFVKHKILKKKIIELFENISKQKKTVTKITAFYRMKSASRKFKKIINSANLIKNKFCSYLKNKTNKIRRDCNELVRKIIFEAAWLKIRFKIETFAAITIQKYMRSYLTRKEFADFVKKINKKKKEFRENRVSLTIQKAFRGYLQRKQTKKLKKSIYHLQAFFKMKHLSKKYKLLKEKTKIIQRVANRWLLNRRAFKDMWKDFEITNVQNYENVKNLENQALFPNDKFKKDSLKKSSNSPYDSNQKTEKLRYNDSGDELRLNEKYFLNFIDQQEEDSPKFDQNNCNDEIVNDFFEEKNEEDIFDEKIFDEIIAYNYPQRKKNIQKDILINSKKSKQKQVEAETDLFIGRKIVLFPLIVDVDLIGDTTDIYKPFWSKLFINAKQELEKNEGSIQMFDIGETFTIAGSDTGSVYSWGSNDSYQLGRKTNEFDEDINSVDLVTFNDLKNPEKLIAGDNHAFIINYEKNAYVWGDNSNGQLGIGTNEIVKTPILHPLLPNKKVKDLKSKGMINLCLLEDGNTLFWPFQKSTGKYILKPVELPLPKNTHISMISCGQNFAMLLSSGGILFSMGRENSEGQLGQGDCTPRNLPTMIEKLKNMKEMIKSVSCGFKHVTCKTGLAKVFVWGSNAFGQLGLGHFLNQLNPKLLSTEKLSTMKVKVNQIKSGFRSSMVLMDDGKVFWCGETGSLQKTSQLVQLDYKSKIKILNEEEEKAKEFIPIKLMSSWSKTLGIWYLTIADTTKVNDSKNQLLKNKVCRILSSKWEEDTIEPPFMESVTKYFTFKSLKNIVLRQKFEKPSMFASGVNIQKNSPDDNFNHTLTREEKERILNLFAMIDISIPLTEKSSPLKGGVLIRAKSPYSMEKIIEKNKEEKLRAIKIKVMNLLKTPKNIWSIEEYNLMTILTDPKVMGLIKKI